VLGDRGIQVAPEVWAKFDPTLRQALTSLNADPTVPLPVVIAIAGPVEPLRSGTEAPRTRDERAALARAREAAFEREVAGLVRQLEAFGATDVQTSWLNRTVSARVGLPGIEAAARRPDTAQVVLAVRRKITA
jgi:hypothetical protein